MQAKVVSQLTRVVEANGLLSNVQRIEHAEQKLLHVVHIIELRLHDVPVRALAVQVLQDHACGSEQLAFASSLLQLSDFLATQGRAKVRWQERNVSCKDKLVQLKARHKAHRQSFHPL